MKTDDLKIVDNSFNNMKTDNLKIVDNYAPIKQFLSGNNAQQRCFDRAYGDKFFVVHQKKYNINNSDKFTNTYTSFVNIDKFLNYIFLKPDDEKLFHELIKNECVEYYDIDGKWADG